MNTELTNVLNQIKSDKDTYLLPQNIKKGVNILGVNGNYEPPLESITASLSTSSTQVLTPNSNYYGLGSVTVPKVTASIDDHIKPENIKRNVEILGIIGTYGFTAETKRATASRLSTVEVVPTQGINYLDKVIIEKVTSSIDPNITQANVKAGVNILGVTGVYAGDEIIQPVTTINIENLTTNIVPDSSNNYTALRGITAVINREAFVNEKEVDISNFNNNIIKPDAGYIGINQLNITNINANIIKSGATILGVTGTYVGDPEQLQEINVNPSASTQVILPDENHFAISKVTVNAVNSSADPNIIPGNIKSGKTILGVTGTVIESKTSPLQVNPNTTQQSFYPASQQGYTGFSSVTVNAVTSNIDNSITSENIRVGVNILGVEGNYSGGLILQEKSVYPADHVQNITPDQGYDALNKVTISAVTTEMINIEPNKNPQDFTPAEGTFYNKVHVQAVSSDCDPNIQPENIKKNMSILGVTGTYEGDTSEYFGSIGVRATETSNVGSWIYSIQALPDTMAFWGVRADGLFAQFQGSRLPLIDVSNAKSFASFCYNCTQLLEIPQYDFSNGTNFMGAFNSCINITTVPNLNLNAYSTAAMFSNCTNLLSTNSITISSYNNNGICTEAYMFNNCTNLRTVNISLSSQPYHNKHNICSMFNHCFNLEGDIDFGEANLSGIGYAFHNCKKLNSVSNLWLLDNTPTYATSIDNAFANSGITAIKDTIIIPKIRAQDGGSANNFASNCYNLKTISNMTIGLYMEAKSSSSTPRWNLNMAFRNCYNLETADITFVSNLNNLGRDLVSLFQFSFENCYKLRNLVKGVVEYPTYSNYTFSNCYNLLEASNIEFKPFKSSTSTTVYQKYLSGTFRWCNNITNVENWSVAGNFNLTVLMYNTFMYCTNLKHVNLSDSDQNMYHVKYNLYNTFYNCVNLEYAYIRAANLAEYVFYNCKNLNFIKYTGNIFIPQTVKQVYQNTNPNVYVFCNSIVNNVWNSQIPFENSHHVTNDIVNMVVVNMPTKTQYAVGESFDPSGMVINVQNLLDANYDETNHCVIENLSEPYTLSTYSIDKTTLSAGDNSVNVFVKNPFTDTSVEIPIEVN